MPLRRRFGKGKMEFVMDCLSGIGAILLWGVAAFVACPFFKAAFNALGWITGRAIELSDRPYAGDPSFEWSGIRDHVEKR